MIRKLFLATSILAGLAITVEGNYAWREMGVLPSAEAENKYQQSKNWLNDRFENMMPMNNPDVSWLTKMYHLTMTEVDPRHPETKIEQATSVYQDYPDSGLAVTWLGHSNVLLEFANSRVLIDPTWGERASPVRFSGPKRFYTPNLSLDDLPQIDVVIVSHDHYDHFDRSVVDVLKLQQVKWVVPLGIKDTLLYWGVPAEHIYELDWWQEIKLGELTLAATPARHYGGRIARNNKTLWSGFVVQSENKKVFYSGDTGLHSQMLEIGQKYGPFDLTLIETGSYSPMWADTHLGPEQAVIANELVQGKTYLPIHWGTYNMAPHGWTEPVERALIAAEKLNVEILTPKPGERIEVDGSYQNQRWWPAQSYRTMNQSPVWSTGMEEILLPYQQQLGFEDQHKPIHTSTHLMN